jgi:protein-S-isoprenylcysteine O-methyltransferase Ste14
MNPSELLTVALAAETQNPSITLTQDPTFDLLIVALALALLLVLVGCTQFSIDRSPASRPSSTIPTWIQVIGVIVVLLILIVIKNS